jgi:hypothetical protein
MIGMGIADSSSIGWETTDPCDEPQAEKRAIRLRGPRGAPLPGWAAPVVTRIRELDSAAALSQRDWRPINFDDVADALGFLERVMHIDTSAPWIGRLSSGGIELTWKHADIEVEAIFDRLRADGVIIVAVGEHEWEEPIDKADSLFASVVDRLSVPYVEHTADA